MRAEPYCWYTPHVLNSCIDKLSIKIDRARNYVAVIISIAGSKDGLTEMFIGKGDILFVIMLAHTRVVRLLPILQLIYHVKMSKVF